MRDVLPDLVPNTIEVVELATIASVVSFPELLCSADMARSRTFNSSSLVLPAAMQVVIPWPLVRLAGWLGHRLAAR